MATETTETDTETPTRRRDFALAYAFWLVVLGSIAAMMWLSSTELATFRYAGF